MAERESQIVLGLDPDPSELWPGSDAGVGRDGSTDRAAKEGRSSDAGATPGVEFAGRVGRAVVNHCCAVIDATAEACVAVKLQLARFEALGVIGWGVLSDVAAHARRRGLLVIADGKRGDIDVTARAYASALLGGIETPFGNLDGLGADLVTVNPLMGRDAIEPFVDAARAAGSGVAVLVRTSNPGAAEIEDLTLTTGGAVWERVAAIVNELGAPGVGEAGLSDVCAVVGATVPRHLVRARELMPAAAFLLPGVGAQGGRIEELAPAFVPGRAGGLIAASRSIAHASEHAGGEPAIAARAQAERMREAAWGLSGRVSRA